MRFHYFQFYLDTKNFTNVFRILIKNINNWYETNPYYTSNPKTILNSIKRRILKLPKNKNGLKSVFKAVLKISGGFGTNLEPFPV